jgi:ABC-type dipeptide/oligopeptide/nickel transport system permease subunit
VALALGAWWIIVPAGIIITLIVFALTMISIGLKRKENNNKYYG